MLKYFQQLNNIKLELKSNIHKYIQIQIKSHNIYNFNKNTFSTNDLNVKDNKKVNLDFGKSIEKPPIRNAKSTVSYDK